MGGEEHGVVAGVGVGRSHVDVDVGSCCGEVPECQRPVLVEGLRHCCGVGDDAGDVRGRRERTDLHRSVGVIAEFLGEVLEIDMAVGRFTDGHDVGDRFSPRDLVGVVLERADEHDRALVGRNGVGDVPAVVEIRRDPQTEHADQLVDGVGRPAATEQHHVIVGGPGALGDDGTSLFAVARRLQPGARRLGVGVGVQRQHRRPDVVLDEAQ